MKQQNNLGLRLTEEGTLFCPSGFVGWLVRAFVLALSAAIALLVCFRYPEWELIGLFVATVLAGWEIFYAAIVRIRSPKSGYLFTAVALFAAALAGYGYESVWSAALISIGFLVRGYHRLSAEEDLAFYDSLRHMPARIKEEKQHTFADVETMPIGQHIEVFGGEVIPCDGVVVSGESRIDYGPLLHTHEVTEVTENSPVYCGGVTLGQPITVRITAYGEYTAAQKMRSAALVSLSDRSGAEIVAERLCTLWGALCAAVALIYSIIMVNFVGVGEAVCRGAALLLIANTSSVSISVWLGMVVGVVRLSRYGVIFRGCRRITALRKIEDVIFTKTGTLTCRHLCVDEIVPHNDVTKEQLLYFAALAEQTSQHLIATAILKEQGGEDLIEPEHSLVLPGEGVCADIKGKRIFVGNEKLMMRAGIEALPYHGSGIVCFVGVENMYAGCIILRDPLKPDSAETVDGLYALGLHSVDIVSGDKSRNAESVGTALSVNHVFSELSMQQKIEVIKRQGKYNRVGGRIAFVGDDVFDSELMEAADISFAVKTPADELGNTVADVAILSDETIGVCHSFRLSYRLHRNAVLLWCVVLLTKIVCAVGIFSGWLPIWVVAGITVPTDAMCISIALGVRHCFDPVVKKEQKNYV